MNLRGSHTKVGAILLARGTSKGCFVAIGSKGWIQTASRLGGLGALSPIDYPLRLGLGVLIL